VCFANAGYPLLLYLRARFWSNPIRKGTIFPRVTILLAAHNEEKNLPVKLANLATLDYPSDLLDVVVVSDGSTDGTDKILKDWEGPGRRSIHLAAHGGKAVALNAGMAAATGEIVVLPMQGKRSRLMP